MLYQNIDFHGAVRMESVKGAMVPRRFPQEVADCLSELGQRVAKNLCGVEMRFIPEGEVRITMSTVSPGAINEAQLYYGSVQGGGNTGSVRITNTPTEFVFNPSVHLDWLNIVTKEENLPFNPQVLRLILSNTPVAIHKVEGNLRPPMPEDLPKQTGIYYGSSITHGSNATASNLYWTRMAAESVDTDQINLGLAGSCRMEAQVADWIAERQDWDYAVLEMGINVTGLYDGDTYRERVRYLMERLHNAHPNKYLFCIDVFYYHRDYYHDSTAPLFREILKEEVQQLNSDRVIHIPGLQILTGPRGLSEDMVHPNIDGIREIADNLSRVLKKYL